MTYAVIAAGIDPSAILLGAQGFMGYGPIGLAGLLIALVLTTVLLRTVDGGRERVLKLVLFLGTFCFIAALVAQHFAPPEKEALDYSKQRAVLSNVVKALAISAPKLQEVINMASVAGCPGESGEIAIPHGADMAGRSSAVLATLGDARSNINSVIDSLPTAKK